MIEYMHRRLAAWGEWSMAREDGGFAPGGGQFRYREPLPPGTSRTGEALSAILADEPALEMELGVSWLRKNEQPTGDVVWAVYRDHRDLTLAQVATLLGCSDRMVYYRRDRAHVLLLDWLHGRTLGESDEEIYRAHAKHIANAPRVKAPA